MDRSKPPILLDAHGIPFSDDLQEVLQHLVPRLLRQFPQLQDLVHVVEVLEEAGQRVLRRQTARGPIANLHGFAWVTLRNVALTRVSLGRGQLAERTLPPDQSAEHLAKLPARDASPAVIERTILLHEALAYLSRDEQLIVAWKQAGLSSAWIARKIGRSVSAVDTAFTRAKQRLRRIVCAGSPNQVRDACSPWAAHARATEAANAPYPITLLDDAWVQAVRELHPWLVDDDP